MATKESLTTPEKKYAKYPQFPLALPVSRATNGAEFRTQWSGSTIELLCRGERVISAFGILTVGQKGENNEKNGCLPHLWISDLKTALRSQSPCAIVPKHWIFGCEVRVQHEQYCSCLHTGLSVPVIQAAGPAASYRSFMSSFVRLY